MTVITLSDYYVETCIPAVAESFLLNGCIAKDIENLYCKNKVVLYSTARKYIETHPQSWIIRSGTLEHELDSWHCIGVLAACSSDEKVRTAVLRSCRIQLPELFACVSRKSPDMMKLFVENMKKVHTSAEENAPLRIAFFLLFTLHGTSFEADDKLKLVVNLMEDHFEKLDSYTNNCAPAVILSTHRSQVAEILQKYKSLRSCADIIAACNILDNRNVRLKGVKFPEPVSLTNAAYDAFSALASLLDMQGLSFTLLFENIRLTKSDFQTIACPIVALMEAEKNSKCKPVFDRYAYLYAFEIVFASLLKEYHASREQCLSKASEEIEVARSADHEEVCALEKELAEQKKLTAAHRAKAEQADAAAKRLAEDERAALYSEMQQLRAEIATLKQERTQWQQEREDWNRLKELAFSLSESEEELPTRKEQDIGGILRSKRVFILGGHQNWMNQMHELYPDLTLVSGTLHSVQPEVFRSADHVFLFTGHMAHTVYDKVTAYLRKNEIPYSYLPRLNQNWVAACIAQTFPARKEE